MNHFPPRLSASSLRWIAMGTMLADHVGRMFFPGCRWMVAIGRLAFPIFAFQIVEGYRHTRSFSNYAVRLFCFALISEIPYDLMTAGTFFDPTRQNVLFTLLLGLWTVRILDETSTGQSSPSRAMTGLALVALLAIILSADYALMGVIQMAVFFLLSGHRSSRLALLLVMAALHLFFPGDFYWYLPLGTWDLRLSSQGFALLSLIPIWLYHGDIGCRSKWLRWFSYGFYPVHMLLLALLRSI